MDVSGAGTGGGRGGNSLVAVFSGGARGPWSHGGVAGALGPKHARPKAVPPTNFRGEAGIIFGLILASF